MKALLLGDVSPTDENREYFQAVDVATLFTDTLPLFEGNDINLVNMECALTDTPSPISKIGPAICAPTATAKVMQAVGVNYCNLSNNHFFDHGIAGAKSGIAALEAAGITATGFGENYQDSRRNLVIEKGGERIVIIAVCEHEYTYALDDRMGSRPFDEIDTLEDIREAKQNADRVIVLYHGGKEHSRYPSPRLMKVCRAMIRAGADVVLGQHSHCIGCYEEYKGGHILYGQGNFHFVKTMKDESIQESWDTLLAVHYDTKTNEIDFTPITREGPGITLAKGKLKQRLLDEFAERNANIQNGKWLDGWKEFCESKSELYTRIVARAFTEEATDRHNQIFAHYLDCEAHSDVWRQLFPTWNQSNEH